MDFGKKLKEIRTQKKISQRELGERLGVSQQTIAQYEHAINIPKLSTLQKFATALDVSVFSLTQDTTTDYDLNELQQLKESMLNDSKSIEELKTNTLLNYYIKLNSAGKDKALEQVELLTKIPEYQKGSENK